MTDLISREEAIEAIVFNTEDKFTVDVLNDVPAVDAVPVVRCKDCKYWKDQSKTTKWLPCSEIQTNGNWFCADGERREAIPWN